MRRMKCKNCEEPLSESEILDGRIYCVICEPELTDLTVTPSVIIGVVELIQQLRRTGLTKRDINLLIRDRAKVGFTQINAVVGALESIKKQIEAKGARVPRL